MHLESVVQVDVSELRLRRFDLGIAASGYESRATYLPRWIAGNCADKIAFAFNDKVIGRRLKNDKILKRLGYSLLNAEGHSDDVVRKELLRRLRAIKKKEVNLFVDYSSMTKVWYGAILRMLRAEQLENEAINVYFGYSCAGFSPPSPTAPNRYMGPLSGFCNFDLPERKSALVVGLGYEAERASGLVDYVEPALTFAFYTSPALSPQYVKAVEKNNRELLRRLGESRIFKYPVMDLRITGAKLASICYGLARDYRVILAPLGPKPFALLCFLIATEAPKFDVWRVSPGKHDDTSDRIATGDVILAKASFRGGG